ncbi:hypothetical protein ACRAWF_25875 [Streptomyces sp. L7]
MTVAGSFVLAAVMLGAFIAAESRGTSPMLRLELFRSPAFSASAAMAVIGMFGFLGGAYDLSIRLGVIQHQSPLRVAVSFLIIQAVTPLIWPLLVRLLQRVGPGPMLVTGFVPAGRGPTVAARGAGARDRDTRPAGTARAQRRRVRLVVAAVTAAAVNAVPLHLTGMAAATTSLVRDLGQTLGPAAVGAVALATATHRLTGSLGAAALTPAEHGTATAVLDAGGPLALHTADLGPLSAKIAPLTERALAAGYGDVLLLTAGACVTAAVIAAVSLGVRPRGAAPARPEGSRS